MKKLSRRAVLRGAGGAAIGLPFLEAMLRPGHTVAQAGSIPPRLVFFFTSCGVVPDTWWPSGGETSFTLGSSLQPLSPFREKLLIVDGIQMTTAMERPGGSNGHDTGTGHSLVCRSIVPGPSGVGEFGHLWDGSAGGISIDQHIANHLEGITPYRSLEFGVDAEGIRQAVPSRISYRAAFEPVIPMHEPGNAFDRILAPLQGMQDPARLKERRRRQLVLEAVQDDLGRLGADLGTDDRRRLEAHVASIEDIATRLDAPIEAVCDPPGRADASDYPAKGRLQLDLIVEALKCDLTRVASIQWSTGQSGTRFNWLGHQDGHHSLSHRGISDTNAKNQVSEIDLWYAQEFAHLIGRLDAVETGDGKSLLDHTTVVWVNEQQQSIGNIHRAERMPFVLAGGGAHFQTGRYLTVPDTPHGELYVSLMHMMGMTENTFGDPDFCSGPIAGLV